LSKDIIYYNSIGINQITQERFIIKDWLNIKKSNVVLFFRNENYLLDLEDLFDFFYNKESNYYECFDYSSTNEYINLGQYGIPNLIVEYLHFFNSIYNLPIEPFDGIIELDEDGNEIIKNGFISLEKYNIDKQYLKFIKCQTFKVHEIREILLDIYKDEEGFSFDYYLDMNGFLDEDRLERDRSKRCNNRKGHYEDTLGKIVITPSL
jgi:hypothetical protein